MEKKKGKKGKKLHNNPNKQKQADKKQAENKQTKTNQQTNK